MINCNNCGKTVAIAQKLTVFCKDYYPYPKNGKSEIEEDGRGIRTNNAREPKGLNKDMVLCNACIELVNKKGFLEINKI
jgi:hypothetical protein